MQDSAALRVQYKYLSSTLLVPDQSHMPNICLSEFVLCTLRQQDGETFFLFLNRCLDSYLHVRQSDHTGNPTKKSNWTATARGTEDADSSSMPWQGSQGGVGGPQTPRNNSSHRSVLLWAILNTLRCPMQTPITYVGVTPGSTSPTWVSSQF